MDITEDNIYYLISRLLDDFDGIRKEYTRRLLEEGYDVTAPQLEILRAVGENPNLSLGELATLTRLHITTIEGYVNRLARKGFVTKEKDARDTRRVVVSLTITGEQIVKSSPSGYRIKLFDELRGLSLEEKVEIYEVLRRLVLLMR